MKSRMGRNLIRDLRILTVETAEPAYLISVVLDWQTEDAVSFVPCDQVHLSIKPGVLEGQNTPNLSDLILQTTFIFTRLLQHEARREDQHPITLRHHLIE